MQSTAAVQKKISVHQRLSVETRFKRQIGLFLISPWLIGLLIFKLVPILASLGISFTDYQLLDPDQIPFIGLQNYRNIFKDAVAGTVLWQTIMACHPPAILACGDHSFASVFLLFLQRDSSGLSLCGLQYAAYSAVFWRSKFSIL